MSYDRRGGRPGLPRPDNRDQGDLSEDLRPLSYELAKFLRYEVSRRKLCDSDGWVPVSDALTELSRKAGVVGNEEEVRRVVRGSFSKDQPRFEAMEDNGRLLIRASNRDKYVDRRGKNGGSSSSHGGWSGGYAGQASSAGSGMQGRKQHQEVPTPTGVPSDQAWPAWGSRPNQSPAVPSAPSWPPWESPPHEPPAARGHNAQGNESNSGRIDFDGDWINQTSGSKECLIKGTLLTWHNGQTTYIQIESEQIVILADATNGQEECVGRLDSTGTITWSDGDAWDRKPDKCSGANDQSDPWAQNDPWTHNDPWSKSTLSTQSASKPTNTASAPARPTDAASATGNAVTREDRSAAVGASAAKAPSADVRANAAASTGNAVTREDRSAAVGASGAKAPSADVRVSAAASTGAPTASCGAEQNEASHAADHCQDKGKEMRALADWDSSESGPEYLSLFKGELLHVQDNLEDGWAFGYSVQSGKEGYFPPSYAGADNSA